VKALNAATKNTVAAGSLLAGLVVTLAVNVSLHALLGPVTLGLAASAGAVVTAAVAAHVLGVSRTLWRWVGACVPVALVAWGACAWAPARGWLGLVAVGGCVLAVFAVAVLVLAPWRRVVLALVR
jgi:hypothetical protein